MNENLTNDNKFNYMLANEYITSVDKIKDNKFSNVMTSENITKVNNMMTNESPANVNNQNDDKFNYMMTKKYITSVDNIKDNKINNEMTSENIANINNQNDNKFNYMLANEYITSVDKAKDISPVANYNMSAMVKSLIEQNEKLKDKYNNYLKLYCSTTFENSYLYQILKQNIEPNFNNLIAYGTNLKNNLKAIECQKYQNTYNNLINLTSYLQNKVIDVTSEDYKIIEKTFIEVYDEYKMKFKNSENSYITHENNVERIINTFNNNYLTENSVNNNYEQSLKNAVDLVEQDINKMNELLENGLKKNNA